MNNCREDSATSCDLIMIPQLRSPTQGLLIDESQNSTQNQVNSIPKIVKGNQFPSTSAKPSTQGLTAWEKLLQERHVKSLNRTRDNSKSNEDVRKEPINHKIYRQQSERDINQKSSAFRGVTKCKDSRFEAFVWDGKNRPGGKGKTVYIGGFKNEIDAAKAHDLIAIKIWGKSTFTNFPASWYSKEISEMENMSETDCILAIRRAVKQDSKIKSNYLGVSRKAKSKKWKARLDKGNGKQAVDLGTYRTSQESQAPQALQNQVENVNVFFQNQFLHQSPSLSQLHNYQNLEPQNNPSFQNGVSSSGLNSSRFYPVEPYNQGFEAPNLGVLNQSYQPVQYGMNQNLSSCFPNSFQNPCSGTNTGFQEGMVGNQNDLDISQIFNSSYMENQQTDVTDNVDNFWAEMQAHMLVSGHSSALGFQDEGM